MLLHSLLQILAFGKWGWRRLTQLGTSQRSHVRSSTYAAQQLGTVEPCSVISSMLTWINRYVTFCNALFSRMQRIPQKCKQNFGGELSIIATLDWCSSACDAHHLDTIEPWPNVPIPTHMNTQMCNHLQCTIFKKAEHPWISCASILGWAVHHCCTDVCSATYATQQFHSV